MSKRYWLFKSEPDTYSIHDLMRDRVTEWSGVRNYQVRNLLRDQVRLGDVVLFYHSSAKEIGVAGIAEVASQGYPDTEQWQPESPYYDPKSIQENPRWYACDVIYRETFPRVVTLAELRAEPALAGMALLRPGSRLSITPVSTAEFRRIVTLAKR